MFKKIVSAVIAITMVLGMCSCGEQSSSEPAKPGVSSSGQSEPTPDPDFYSNAAMTGNFIFAPAVNAQKNDEDFIKGMSGFSVELFKKAVNKDLSEHKNTLVSPESVAFALGMTMNGANGETLKQMQNVMCGGVELDKFNRNMNLIMTNALNNSTADSKLSIANSVWVKDNKNIMPTEQFAKSCKQIYNAELFRAPFSEQTVNNVNSWVNDKTDKMIPKIIDRFTGDELMCLVNCIAFDSKWENEYEEEQVKKDQDFTNASGEKVNCTMLCSTEKNYVENSRATGFVKIYKGGKYAFMAVLPNEGTDISSYVSSMEKDELSGLYSSSTKDYDVITRLPEFKYDHGTELNDVLIDMGMSDAFGNADFSKMFEDKNTAISRVIHKTHIELNAKGTKAAAATAVMMRENADAVENEVKQVILDRPFVYAIMDTETQLPVFIGTVCDPSVQ